MGIVVPTAQFRTEYLFVASQVNLFNWVTIVAPTGAVVRVNGTLVNAADFTAIPGTPWVVAHVLLSLIDLHRVSASAPVGVYVFGYTYLLGEPAAGASYMFPAGMDLRR